MDNKQKSTPQNLWAPSTTIPEVFQISYFPSLDGLRAVSVIIVIGFHLYLVVGSDIYYRIFFGPLGVNFFFVISGFLITSLLIKEKVKNGTISLKGFYRRRFLRIFPAAYAYLIINILLSLLLSIDINYINLTGCFLYLSNFSFFGNENLSWAKGHYWSLAIEEQFYLLFPFILSVRFKMYVLTLIAIIFVLPLYFFLAGAFPDYEPKPLYWVTHFLIKFQGIAVGSFIAILLFKNIIKMEWFDLMPKFTNVINLFILVGIFSIGFDPRFSETSVIVNLFSSFMIAFLIVFNLFNKGLLHSMLNWQPLKYIGLLSYGLYIWHPLFTEKHPSVPEIFTAFPINLIFIFLAALLSYYVIERPFLKMKNRRTVNNSVMPEKNEMLKSRTYIKANNEKVTT